MRLSIVVPTLNGRDRLAACLDSLSAHAPDAEVVVVNGPSADGTTGMVRDRTDVDTLVEVSDRSVTVARNAGIEAADGDVVAFVDFDRRVTPSWRESLADGLREAPVVTGPSRGIDGSADEGPERRRIGGRTVTYFNGGNVAFTRRVLRDLDGFDEYLEVGGARDAAHRLAGMDVPVAWRGGMGVRAEPGGLAAHGKGWKYRGLAYRLVKNYGVRPTIALRTVSHAVRDATAAAGEIARGNGKPTTWFSTGREVISGIVTGASDGVVARSRDRSPARNPHGVSARADRTVARYRPLDREGPGGE